MRLFPTVRLVALLVLAALAAPASAQDGPILPGLVGNELLAGLDAEFSPTATYSYDRTRDSLFALSARLSPSGDSIQALYTGHAVFLPRGADPTQAACDGDGDGNPSSCNGPRNLNAEHVWPQSYGTDAGDARSDGHHLFPARADVNSTRGNRPFGTVTDVQADRWWRRSSTQHTPPASPADWTRIDLDGPGVDGDRFAPRDDRRGEVARAVFYIRAVYPDRLDGDALVWFEGQVETLLVWHAADPSSDTERRRSNAVARWQGTPNPFVLDATLAERAFGESPIAAVALATFTATQEGDGARVEWETLEEVGVVQFLIDGRADAFGSAWTRWGVLDAAGTPGAYRLNTLPLAVGEYRVRVLATTTDGGILDLGDVGLSILGSTGADDRPRPAFALAPPVPNPSASGAVRAVLTVREPARVLAVVYDALGREVSVVYDAAAVGHVEVAIDTTRYAPGTYVLRAAVLDGSDAATRRFTVAR